MRRSEHVLSAIAAGVLVALASGVMLWVYLSSIQIDDGLEGLAFFPILLCAGGLVALVAGWRRARVRWAVVCAAVADLTIGLEFLVWQATKAGVGPPILQNVLIGIFLIFPVALSGTLCGWACGNDVRQVVSPRPLEPLPPSPQTS